MNPRSFLPAAAVLLLSACAGDGRPPATAPAHGAPATTAAPASPRPGEPAPQRRVTYRCANGEELELRAFPLQGVGVLVRGGRTLELQEERVASGFHFVGGGTTVRGKGDEVNIAAGGAPPLACTALRAETLGTPR